MSRLPDEALWLRSAQACDLPRICEIEQKAHPFAWELMHFQDCLNAGYEFEVLTWQEKVLGYQIAMQAPQEMHLLNITVDSDWQGQGLGGFLLRALMLKALRQGAQSIWLEVRDSNIRARAVYEALGFEVIRRRKDYYPAGAGQREDAWVMRYLLRSEALATALPAQEDIPHG